MGTDLETEKKKKNSTVFSLFPPVLDDGREHTRHAQRLRRVVGSRIFFWNERTADIIKKKTSADCFNTNARKKKQNKKKIRRKKKRHSLPVPTFSERTATAAIFVFPRMRTIDKNK